MTTKFKHLVTSGCSFSAINQNCWNVGLGKILNLPLTNMAVSSAGNSWISKSAIHAAQNLIEAGLSGEEILLIVMWSGIDRKETFISSRETSNYKNLLAAPETMAINPANFIDSIREISDIDGYLLGTLSCQFGNKKVNDFKRRLIGEFYPDEALAIESYENFLRLQWYCVANNITLINLTYMDLMHYPRYHFADQRDGHPLTTEFYPRNVAPLHRMIDSTKWIFWKESGGLYEYTRDNNLPFAADNFHPYVTTQEYYARTFLLPALKERFTGII